MNVRKNDTCKPTSLISTAIYDIVSAPESTHKVKESDRRGDEHRFIAPKSARDDRARRVPEVPEEKRAEERATGEEQRQHAP